MGKFKLNNLVWGQGWLVILIGLALLLAGLYVGETDDAPGATGLGVLLFVALILIFGYWKGEKPRWQWGMDKKDFKNDKSIGVIPIFKKGEEIKVVLVQHAKGHWGFPKGHPDSGESEVETALRELAEETGLTSVELLPNARLEETYDFEKEGVTYHKTVIYFIGMVEGEPKVPADFAEEILALKLFTPEEALTALTYPEAKNILKEGLKFIG